MDALPNEILEKIFQELDFISQRKLCSVSRRWNAILTSRAVLRNVSLTFSKCTKRVFYRWIFNWSFILSRLFETWEANNLTKVASVAIKDISDGYFCNEFWWHIDRLCKLHNIAIRCLSLENVTVQCPALVGHFNRYTVQFDIVFQEVEVTEVDCPKDANFFSGGITVTNASGRIDAKAAVTRGEDVLWDLLEAHCQPLCGKKLKKLDEFCHAVSFADAEDIGLSDLTMWRRRKPTTAEQAEIFWITLDVEKLSPLIQQLLWKYYASCQDERQRIEALGMVA